MKRSATPTCLVRQSKRQALDTMLPALSSPHDVSVDLQVRKNEQDSWRSLITTQHAMQKMENGIHHILVHSIPEHLFAIKCSNYSSSHLLFNVTVDGKPTRIIKQGDKGKRWIVRARSSLRLVGFAYGTVNAQFVFGKSQIAQDAGELDRTIDRQSLGKIEIQVSRAEVCGERETDPHYHDDFDESAFKENIRIKEADSKRIGILTQVGALKKVDRNRGKTTTFTEHEHLKTIVIHYRDTMGMISSYGTPLWRGENHTNIKLFETTPQIPQVIEIDDDVPAMTPQPSPHRAAFLKKKEAIDKISKWSPSKVAQIITQDPELQVYKLRFKMNEIDGSMLIALTDKDLKLNLLVENEVHRQKILDTVQILVEKVQNEK